MHKFQKWYLLLQIQHEIEWIIQCYNRERHSAVFFATSVSIHISLGGTSVSRCFNDSVTQMKRKIFLDIFAYSKRYKLCWWLRNWHKADEDCVDVYFQREFDGARKVIPGPSSVGKAPSTRRDMKIKDIKGFLWKLPKKRYRNIYNIVLFGVGERQQSISLCVLL